jgi:hypothetical protein
MSATAKKPLVNYLDHLPQGWFALDVMPVREDKNCQVWAALLVDVEPDNLKRCDVDFPALFYVDPEEHRPGFRKAHQGWYRVPGKHRSEQKAWDALQDLMAVRH